MAPRLLARFQPARERPEPSPHGSQTRPKQPSFVRRWLREPLLHFLLAGALIFAIYELLNPAANRTDRANQIVLTKNDLRQLAVHWLAQGRPPPTAEQMRALVEQRVSEEILFREALRRKNGCEFPGLRHDSPFTTRQTSTIAPRPGQVVSPSRSLLTSELM
jgi:peptidyl-prolyl cis-trans isomerase C